MKIYDLQKAGEIGRQIEELEKIINYKLTPLDNFLIIRQKPRLRLAIKHRSLFNETTFAITSEILSDAIKNALKRTIEDLKSQLVELGVEVQDDSKI